MSSAVAQLGQTTKIILRARNPKKQSFARVTPLPDRKTGKLYTGQGNPSASERERLPFIVTDTTTITVRDGLVMDLTDEVDKINWKWMQRHPYIAPSQDAMGSMPDAVFYVENLEKQAEVRVKTEKSTVAAKYKIGFEAGREARNDLAKIFGLPAPGEYTEDRLNEFLFAEATVPEKAEIILNFLKPENEVANYALVLFKELLFFGIIYKGKGGTYRYGSREDSLYLGHKEAEAVEYIKSSENESVVAAMMALLKEEKLKRGF